jgi:hypothetical protein
MVVAVDQAAARRIRKTSLSYIGIIFYEGAAGPDLMVSPADCEKGVKFREETG